jgi:hypothetical protein
MKELQLQTKCVQEVPVMSVIQNSVCAGYVDWNTEVPAKSHDFRKFILDVVFT